MSTPQGGNGRSSGTVRVSGKSSSVSARKAPGARPSSASGGGPRKPDGPMKVAKQRDWSWIGLTSLAAVIALSIIGYAIYQNWERGRSWKSKADSIHGIVDYRDTNPDLTSDVTHDWGPLKYTITPPVAGSSNYNWQRCAGDVYTSQIANEHAVNSLQHGAIWITYNPDTLPKDQVALLAQKVRGIGDYILMSPYPGLKSPISLQAWGFGLQVKSATDGRIDQFIKDLRINASMDPGVDCSSGDYITATGTTPHDVGRPADTSSPSAAPSAAPSG